NKIGIHLSTFTKEWSEDIFPYFKQASEIGYDGVEIPLLDPFTFDTKKAKELLLKYNLECTCGTGLSKEANIASLDPIIQAKGIAHLKKALDIASELNAEVLGGVTYAAWGILGNKQDLEAEIKQAQLILKDLEQYAKEKNVILCLEILNRYETSIINTTKQGLAFLSDFNESANIGLHYDTFHAHIEEKNQYQALLEGNKWIKHIHFCENTRGTPLTGQIDFKAVRDALKAINYQGWIVLENFIYANGSVGNGTYIWQQVENSGYDAALNGYLNIRKILEEEDE
ncbi:MAG: sugar phosphate isomerase/epimerase family protein, partial [Bacilli bacterium]